MGINIVHIDSIHFHFLEYLNVDYVIVNAHP